MTVGPPIVDLRDFQGRKHCILDSLMSAAVSKGFFYISNHGISQQLIDRAFACSTQYFQQPTEVKAAFPTTDWSTLDLLGYKAYRMQEGGKLSRESCIQKYPVHKGMDEVWPSERSCPGFRDTSVELMHALQQLVDRLMSLFAVGLGFPEDFFADVTDAGSPENNTMLDYTKHHSLEGVELGKLRRSANRITAHTDESLITLLLHSPGSVGLESAAGRDGQAVGSKDGHYKVDRWEPCPSKPGCIIVNIGDMLQYWSDGLLKSNFHRVRLPQEGEFQAERYTIAWFVWPRDGAVIQGRNKLYPPTTMREFMKIKGKMFESSFHPDPEVHLANQHIVFGAPKIPATAAALSAAGPLKEQGTAFA